MAIRQWEEVENPQAPTRRLSGKQPLTKPEVDLPDGYPVRIVPPREVPAMPLADDGEYEPDLRFLHLSAVVWEKEATSVEDLVRENEELRQIHWGWRLEMSKCEGEGRLQGCWMEFLQTQLHVEQDLMEQAAWLDAHSKKIALKLAPVKCNPEEGQDEEPPAVLQTYIVPLAAVRKEIDLLILSCIFLYFSFF